MKQPGYSGVTIQNEQTGSGPFDIKHIRQRQAHQSRGTASKTSYPNPTNENLNVLPGEIVIYRKSNAAMTTKHGSKKLAVFSSLNGYNYTNFIVSDLAMRQLGFAGISKTLYTLPGESQTNGTYQTDSGLAWLESGLITIRSNTGTKVINAGDLVCLKLPPPNTYHNLSPNTAGHGMAKGKYVMMTMPVDPFDFTAQLQTYSVLLLTSKSAKYTPGIVDMKLSDLYKPANISKVNSNAQKAAAALFYGIIGIYFSVDEVIKENLGTSKETKELLLDSAVSATRTQKDLAIRCVQQVLLHNVHSSTTRQKLISDLQTKYGNTFDKGRLKPIGKSDLGDTLELQKMYLMKDALTNLFGAIGDASYEKNRWVIGKAQAQSHVGQALDINIGDFSRPMTF